MTNVVAPSLLPLRGAALWPLSVAADRVLGEAGLIPEHTELLFGFVYHKPAKSPFHSFLVARLLRLLQTIVPATHLTRSEQPLTCVDSEPEPDVSVVQGREGDFIHDHPHTAELVIEVSVTSHDYDRHKLAAYAKAGVKEYWLVLGPERLIGVYRQPKDGQFMEKSAHGPGESIKSACLPQFTLSVDALFAN